MTEEEWLSSTSVPAMLRDIQGRVSEARLLPFVRTVAGYLWPESVRSWDEGARKGMNAPPFTISLFQVAETLSGFAIHRAVGVGQGIAAREEARRAQANLLREILGNPFRPVVIDPAWLTWNDAALVKMTQRIQEEQRFDAMPILADALEDAGCTDAALLSHCRESTEHIRDCWALNLLLHSH